MKHFKLLNISLGWLTFLIASVVYILTIEPTTSFWDCGEFITSAYKLEVGHPPGAAFFMLMGRLFSLFSFGDVTMVAKMINIISALASAFTILFLFWTITHIAKKVVIQTMQDKDRDAENADEPLFNTGNAIAILGSGLVGALAYTFSDTFWFSAVEGEVYATSSLITAFVFWAILKWENVANEKYANRWLILIAFLIGISIGVHLLNLLAIPAMVFVYYFKKYKPTPKGVIAAIMVSVVLLSVIMYGIIPGIVTVASKFELLFVNGFGLPYSSGIFVYIALLLAAIIWGLYSTFTSSNTTLNTVLSVIAISLLGIPFFLGFDSGFKIFLGFVLIGATAWICYYINLRSRQLMNTILLGFIVIMIGYSSFAIIVIRSSADTPMNQNSPDNLFAMLSYLNREQYGDRPLFYGQFFNAPILDIEHGTPAYVQRNGKYKIIDHKTIYKYEPEYKTIFPRMYSEQSSPPHVDGYLQWAKIEESELYEMVRDENGQPRMNRYGEVMYDRSRPKRPPTFGENLYYFFNYQIGFMYLRYFMWNFAGRQNDIQGHGSVINGNWISGIKPLDESRIGNLDQLPKNMKDNKGRNVYFFFPLLLGLAGMFFLMFRNTNYFWVTMLLFFFTGIAIVIYLNQPPFQPRERDYAYAGSFYAFAIWIGFGVLALYELVRKVIYNSTVSAVFVTIATLLLVPVIMAGQNWDDHDRSGRYTARDFAYNYLNSCAPNAILFTNGDNDTFPLWYAQEVEGIRTDVRVINLSYLNTDWYIDQMKRKAYKSDPVPFSLTHEQYAQGTRDIVRVIDQPELFRIEKYEANKTELEPRYEKIYSRFISHLKNSKFPDIQAKDYNVLVKGHQAISPIRFHGLVSTLKKDENIEKYALQADSINSVYLQSGSFIKAIENSYLPIDIALDFIADESDASKVMTQGGDKYHYLPSRKLLIPVDKEAIRKNKVVPPELIDSIQPIRWTIPGNYLRKSELMLVDLLASNDWERPIYFAVTVGPSGYMNLQQNFQIDGLAYRVVPIEASGYEHQIGRVAPDIMYENMINKFKWGGINDPDVYLDENNRRMAMNLRNNFSRLASALVKQGEKDKAVKVLDKCVELMPHKKIPYNYYNVLVANAYYEAGEIQKGNDMIETLANVTFSELRYYMSLGEEYSNRLEDEDRRSVAVIQEVMRIAEENKQEKLAEELRGRFNQLMMQFSGENR